jgi:GntR family transcriptional regulator
MDNQKRINRNSPIPLYIQLADVLKDLIQSGGLAAGEKIPSERELMKQFRLSRNTIRQAVSQLNNEGIKISNHGAGTFVTKVGEMIRSRIDIFAEHNHLLQTAGFTPSSKLLSVSVQKCDEMVAQKLAIEPGTDVVCFRKIFFADGTPALLVFDYMDRSAVDPNFDDYLQDHDFFDYLETYVGAQIQFSISDIIPVNANEDVSKAFRIEPNSAVLLMTEAFIDPLKQKPVGMGKNYYSDIIQFSILRKRFS